MGDVIIYTNYSCARTQHFVTQQLHNVDYLSTRLSCAVPRLERVTTHLVSECKNAVLKYITESVL